MEGEARLEEYVLRAGKEGVIEEVKIESWEIAKLSEESDISADWEEFKFSWASSKSLLACSKRSLRREMEAFEGGVQKNVFSISDMVKREGMKEVETFNWWDKSKSLSLTKQKNSI